MEFEIYKKVNIIEILNCFLSSVLAIDVKTSSQLTALSDSVMRQPALNDIRDDASDQASDHSGMQLFYFFCVPFPGDVLLFIPISCLSESIPYLQ